MYRTMFMYSPCQHFARGQCVQADGGIGPIRKQELYCCSQEAGKYITRGKHPCIVSLCRQDLRRGGGRLCPMR